ncbi:MAG: ComF family protein [Pseudomonadales bacterium]|nr:ComF family protein [Pseudomonadales bacterium]MCP5184342.1 ComF family protein [Pseudomonadales bacterium]
MRRLKFHADFRVGSVLGDLLAQAVADQLVPGSVPSLVIPVPLSGWRGFLRGFNQSVQLAAIVSRNVGIPMDCHLLRRVRHTPHQTGLARARRRRNVRGAFRATRQLHGEHLALLDDVLTTGATLNACTRTLLDAGAASVEWWVTQRAV